MVNHPEYLMESEFLCHKNGKHYNEWNSFEPKIKKQICITKVKYFI